MVLELSSRLGAVIDDCCKTTEILKQFIDALIWKLG